MVLSCGGCKMVILFPSQGSFATDQFPSFAPTESNKSHLSLAKPLFQQ
jgi:hypothetical protein